MGFITLLLILVLIMSNWLPIFEDRIRSSIDLCGFLVKC